MPRKRNNSFFVAILLLITSFAYAQPKINSPYSRVGLGDLETQSYAAMNGFANLASAYNDYAHSNFRNPASLSFLRTTAFELGINARYGRLQSGDSEAKVWSGNLSYIGLSFPIRNIGSRLLERDKSPIYWGMGFNLQPYSTVGYEVSTMAVQVNLDTIEYDYQGTGGTYQIQWSNGAHYRWTNNGDTTTHRLAAGLSLGYLFGNISTNQSVDFSNTENYYRDLIENDANISGLLWNFGVQYNYTFPNKANHSIREADRSKLTIGTYGHSGNNIDVRTDRLTRRFNASLNDLDTIAAGTFTDSLLHGQLPAEFGIGVMYRFRKNKATWKVGADYSFSNWSKYYNEAKDEREGDLENAWRMAVGAEYIPNGYLSLNNYFDQVRYRMGFFYGRDPRGGSAVGINNSLTQYGITLGFGLPIILKNETSFVNFAFELGSLNGENSIKDTYGKLTVGFTFNDNNWFYKRKFN